jgi:AraC-like DNA-binding protein
MTRLTTPEPIVLPYREYQPSAELSPFVECFWTHETPAPQAGHRVLPDGCADILFTRPSDGRSELLLVGTMTHAGLFDLPQGSVLGVRFRPGMSVYFAHVPGTETVDQRLPLQDVWGAKARQLSERLGESSSIEAELEVLESQLRTHLTAHSNSRRAFSPAERVLHWAEQERGLVSVDELAHHAGLSARQLRRLFLELTGVTPKQLCRAIRFRHAAVQARLAERGTWSQVALDCGYYDQAHFINEFRALSGLTPGEYCADAAVNS